MGPRKQRGGARRGDRKIERSDLVEAGRHAARLAQERYAWPCVFANLFGIYREVREGFRRD
jgi:hypothetical protein